MFARLPPRENTRGPIKTNRSITGKTALSNRLMANTISLWNFAYLAFEPFGAPHITNIADVDFLFDNQVEYSEPSGLGSPTTRGNLCFAELQTRTILAMPTLHKVALPALTLSERPLLVNQEDNRTYLGFVLPSP